MIADEAGAGVAAALQDLEATVGASSRVLGEPTVGPEAALEAAFRASFRAFAFELGQEGQELDLVVAHGWPVAPAAERVAARRAAGLVVVASPPPAEGPLADLAAWAAERAQRVLSPPERGGPTLTAACLGEAYNAALARRRTGPAREAPARIYDVTVRPEGLSNSIVEALLGMQRFAIEKGAPRAEWRATCARSRIVLLSGDAPGLADLVGEALAAGCLPLLVGGAARDPRAVPTSAVPVSEGAVLQEIARWLGDPTSLARHLTLAREAAPPSGATCTVAQPVPAEPALPAVARPLRLVLNHGALVAEELQASLAPIGWELRPLLSPGRDPLPSADLLLVLPYGDPRGALEALRRAKRVGVPTAFWNVEDPRYFFDPELGPLVLAAAKEATATFSTTTQLAPEYRARGVELRYLPNFGRGFFLRADPLEEDERTIDVLFLGTLTLERRRFLEEYRAALGAEVGFVMRDDVRDPTALRNLVGSARLGLSVGTMTDATTPHGLLRGEGLTERLFDYPLAGTPVLSDARGNLADTFVEGEDLLVFQDVGSAVALTRELLRDPGRRAALTASARRKILDRHLGRHRILSIVEALAAIPGASPILGAALAAARSHLGDLVRPSGGAA